MSTSSLCRLFFPIALAGAIGCNQRPPEISPSTGGTTGAGGALGGAGGASAGGSAGSSSTGGSGGAGNPDAFVLPEVTGTGGGGGGADAGPVDERQCGLENFTLEKTPPDLMLVLDRSSSMNQMVPGAAAGATLWTETLAAVDNVVMNTQMGVNWGLKLFPLPTGCQVSMGAEVPVAASNYMPVIGKAQMEGTNTLIMGTSGTPTDTAVSGAASYLTGLAATRKNPKYILLATDGEPTCVNGAAGDGDDAAVNAITAAATAGFKTYVIGLAIGASGTATLNRMAVAGGVPRMDPAVRYYPVANRADLVTALTAITGQVTNCVFTLMRPPPVPDNVKVTVDGMKVDQNAMNGWSYTSPMNTAIQFNGAICEQIKMGNAQVNIVFGCPGIVIP